MSHPTSHLTDYTTETERGLLAAVGRRHATTLPPQASVHLSAAVDALTDPLVLPAIGQYDDENTADLPGALRGIRARLLDTARSGSTSAQQVLAIGLAVRELNGALAVLARPARDAGAGRRVDGPVR